MRFFNLKQSRPSIRRYIATKGSSYVQCRVSDRPVCVLQDSVRCTSARPLFRVGARIVS